MIKIIRKLALSGLGIIFFGMALLLTSIFVYLDRIEDLSQRARGLSPASLAKSSVVFDHMNNPIGEFGDKSRHWVTIDRVPDHTIHAIVSAEDSGYFHHWGVSPIGVIRAAFTNLKEGRIAQGGSTITQQLSRLIFLNKERTFQRKIDEVILAFFLEKYHDKEKILEFYLNGVFFGHHSYGIGTAAYNYFRKSCEELTVSESALLAGVIQAPSRLALHRNFRKAKKRQKYVLSRMVAGGYLSNQDARLFYRKKTRVYKGKPPKRGDNGYFLEQIKREVEKKLASTKVDESGYKLKTTIRAEIQKEMGQSLDAFLIANFQEKYEVQSAFVVMNPVTGGIYGLKGGNYYAQSQFNRAISTRRPVGSLFLPILFSLALEKGFSLSSSIYRDPLTQGPRVRGNDGNDLSLYEGLIQQRTYDSARVLAALGIGSVRDWSRRLGIKFRKKDMGLALGMGKASLMDLATAFSVFANGGKRVQPHFLLTITDHLDRVLYTRKVAKSSRIMSKETAFIINKTLMDFAATNTNIAEGYGLYYSVTDDLQDMWLLVYSPKQLTGIWIGSEQGESVLVPSVEEGNAVLSRLAKHLTIGRPKPSEFSIPKRIRYKPLEVAGDMEVFLPYKM